MADLADGLNRVVFDTSSCIYFLEGAPNPRRSRLLPVVHRAAQGSLTIILPTMVIVELLIGPLRAGDREGEAAVRLFAAASPGIQILELTFDIACAAAELRAKHRLRTPDAVILATAALEADGVIGNDQTWRSVTETRFINLDS
ncbi:MAG: type II toxin-antitoxin system VapC family toxin [Chloroflexota bacterium]